MPSTKHTNVEIKKTEPIPFSLSDALLQTCLFASVLEDTFLQIRILGKSDSFLSTKEVLHYLPILKAVKFGVQLPPMTELDDPRTFSQESSDSCQLNKLFDNRYLTLCSLISLHKELLLHKTFKSLADRVDSLEVTQLDKKVVLLTSDRDKLRYTKRELERNLRQQRIRMKNELYETNLSFNKLKHQLEDANIYAGARSYYMDRYQNARFEQNLKMIQDNELSCGQKIEQYKKQNDMEFRAHSEIEMLLHTNIEEILVKVNHWMEKYDRDIEVIEIKIHLKKNDYESQVDKNNELQDKYDEHAKEIETWKAFKAAREKVRLHKEKMDLAAVAVQAWWRGLMVRQQLGPYKPKKKKAKKPSKGKK